MKASAWIGLIGCAVLLAGCETTDVSKNGGNQEAKRRAALAKKNQESQPDEATANIWYAHDNQLNRDTNPLRAY